MATSDAPVRPPRIYDHAPAPAGRECQMWAGETDVSPCHADAAVVVVYEASTRPDDDRRRNVLACPDCAPVECSGGGTAPDHPVPGEVRALNGLSWEPWVLVTRVERDDEENMLARFAVIDNMDDDALAPIPDDRVADLEASVGDREWRETIAERIDENDGIDKRWCPVDRLDVLGAPGIQGCDWDDRTTLPAGGEARGE
jgi:hypothetical protein